MIFGNYKWKNENGVMIYKYKFQKNNYTGSF